jgi:Zn-dependent membrane protease YugP
LKKLLEMNPVRRTVILWIVFMVALWLVFGIGLLTHPGAYQQVPAVERETGWPVAAFILGSNGILLLLISAGNLFVRFGSLTPGLLILAYEAAAIGWTAGTNGFMEPFPSVAAANAAFLRIGLWETTAYVLLCAVTLPKSLNVAATFPAKQWSRTSKLQEIRFCRSEVLIAAFGIFSLVGAALLEAF